jgi:hypothetical protein
MRRRFTRCEAAAKALAHRRSILDKDKRDDRERRYRSLDNPAFCSSSDWVEAACCIAADAACSFWN